MTSDESEPEVLPPDSEKENETQDASLTQLAFSFVSNYTDRPDLMIAAIEKHDPGFIQKMNKSAMLHAESIRETKHHFGKHQAYTSLVMRVVISLAIVPAFFYALSKDLGFSSLIALAIFYAVVQGGNAGFAHIIKALVKRLER